MTTMSTHKLNIRFTDKQGNRGKIRMYFPEIDIASAELLP